MRCHTGNAGRCVCYPFLSEVDHRGGIGGLRSSDRNSATTRDCTAPVRALFVGCMETKQLSQYPYEKAKFRHNLHKRPVAVLWASVTPNGLWPGWKKKTKTVTSVGTRNMYQGRERALSYNHPKLCMFSNGFRAMT
jgi:hypothetical protein